MDMEALGTRFEVLVGTLVSPPMLAAFRLPLKRVAVPRNQLRRLRIAADRDVPAVLHRLTERDVEVLEIRQCAAPARRDETAQDPPAAPGPDPVAAVEAVEAVGGVVVPFRRTARPGTGA
jgi:hypothetical protein